jgi:hypothetical protein
MKILILHGIDSVDEVRRTSLHHAFFLPRHAPGHDYWFQSAAAPVTDGLRQQRFDAIIIDTTFLGWRWYTPRDEWFGALRRKYAFVAQSDAVKVAFPQDEYDHTALLDEWLADWRVDVVYSVCYDDREVFYPRASQRAEVRLGYTGLYEPADRALAERFSRPWREREVDVGYRAKKLPPWFGWFGALKSDIADRFVERSSGMVLRLDISTDLRRAYLGDEWLRFLGRCRFILGCESGSSLLDADGSIKACCQAFLQRNPRASFADVERSCFPGQDRARPFKAISPRLFEAAAAGCAQILVPGPYAGALKPWVHYLPLEADASNVDELVAAMRDLPRMEAMIAASQSVLLDDRFSYAAYATDVLAAIRARRPLLPDTTADDPMDAMLRTALAGNERWRAAYEAAVPAGALAPAINRTVAGTQRAVSRFVSRARRLSSLLAESWQARRLTPLTDALARQRQMNGEQ